MTLSALVSVALGCSGEFELATVGTEVEPILDDAPFRFDPRDYTARDVPPPSRAAAWSWPEPEAFRARFEERAENMRTFGIAVGRRTYIDRDGVETRGWRRSALSVVASKEGSPAMVMADDLYTCFRGPSPRLEVSAGDPFEPGSIRIGSTESPSYFDVEYASQPRRLHDEDFRDLVYSRALVESGLARGQGILESLPRPKVELEVLARGPVDLTRFFIGSLLDEGEELGSHGSRSRAWWVAAAAFDAGHAAATKDELFRRARDPERDTWTRVRMLSMLTALVDVERVPRDEWPKEPHTMRAASAECALAVLAEPFWTVDEAYERCVGQLRRISEQLATGFVPELEARRLRRALHVEPP